MAKNPFPKAPVKAVKAGGVRFGGGAPLALVAGPCVIESRDMAFDLAARLAALAKKESIPFVFKASYDKANRTSIGVVPRSRAGGRSRDPGRGSRRSFKVPDPGGRALRCRKSVATGRGGGHAADAGVPVPPDGPGRGGGETGRVVNIKKGQFLAPWDIRHVIDKIEAAGCRNILLTERGESSFGYNNLVADFRSLLILREFGLSRGVRCHAQRTAPRRARARGPAATGNGRRTFRGRRRAAGCDGLFWETHRNPPEAKSDKDNALPLAAIGPLWRQCRRIDELA
jgi:2-dehydro-3-deoxyphosphooctonate aldolase (KDO 8-P synthase)